MDMVGHEHPGMDMHQVFDRILMQPGGIGGHIAVRIETDLAVVSSLNDMLGDPNRRGTRQSRHASLLDDGFLSPNIDLF
jgi:hypothetical protein